MRIRHGILMERDRTVARNRIIHGHLGIDDGLIRHRVETSIPKLSSALEDLHGS